MSLNVRTLRDQLNAFLLLQRTYKNWIEIARDYITRKPLNKVVLRAGNSIPLGRKPSSLAQALRHYHRWYDPSIYNLIGLAKLLSRGWKIKHVDNDYLLLSAPEPGTILKCRLNQGTDISLVAEIFIRQVYGSDFDQKVVVDVGAYNGDSAIYFARRGARLVIGLEPDIRSLELARENIKLNNLEDKVKLLNVALSTRTGESRLGVNAETPNISQIAELASVPDEMLEIKTVTVEEIMKRFNLHNIDFLKMNCEGCEYGIFRTLPATTLESINEIILEFHNGPLDIPNILSQHGFAITMIGHSFGYITAKRVSN
jgi:FkbM family methyltransferase